MCKNILDWLTRPNWRAQLKQAREQMGSSGDGALMPLVDMLTEASGTQGVETLAQIQKLARIGKPRTAVEEAYFAMDAAPTYLPLHILVGDLLLQQGLYAEAAEKFSVVARAYDIRGDINHSIGLYRKIVDLSPMDMNLRNQLIDMLVGHGRLDDAVNEYMRLADIHYSLADLVNTRKSLEDATRLSQRSSNRSLRAKVLSRMADIDMQSLDWRQALRSFEQLRDLDPADDHARKRLIELNFRLGQGQQALTEMNIFINALIDRQEFDTALQFMESLLEAHPKQPAILRQAAEVNRRAGNIEMAVAQLDRAGELFLEAGNKPAATDTILTILSLNPPNKAEYQALLAQLRGG
jgi:tetratricopeptide (TPR) repeat protein